MSYIHKNNAGVSLGGQVLHPEPSREGENLLIREWKLDFEISNVPIAPQGTNIYLITQGLVLGFWGPGKHLAFRCHRIWCENDNFTGTESWTLKFASFSIERG